MFTIAKDWQFAKLAGLILAGDDGTDPEWIGNAQQWREYVNMRAKDDRGEYERYPWQPIKF